MERLIETVASDHIRVNCDPANLVIWPSLLAMRRGERYDKGPALEHYQPVAGARVLGPYVVHTHAKDAIVRDDGKYQEVPLGTGWIDWPQYLKNLHDAGYRGYFAIEREVGDDPVGDVRRAVEFLWGLWRIAGGSEAGDQAVHGQLRRAVRSASRAQREEAI